jgi:2-hydroxymuconate-semialdehyde hydrolase
MHRFLYDTDTFGDSLAAIAAQRADVASREEIRRSHLRTFSPDGPVQAFTPEQLGEIAHEVLLVHGREDRIIPLECSYFFEAHLPNAELHVLPKTGHWVQIEAAERFRSLATWYLDDATGDRLG